MSIIKHAKRKQNPFAQIERALLDNADLSWGAKGMLSYLLSKPEKWTVRMTDLERRATDGKYTVKRYMKELIEAGYVVRQHARGKGGKLAGVEFIVHEHPVDREQVSPRVDSTESGLYRQSVKQPLSNKEDSSNKELLSKKECCSKREPKQQQPVSESEFYLMRDELRPDLPDVLPGGQTLWEKFLELNENRQKTRKIAEGFFEREKRSKETSFQRRQRLKREEYDREQAIIEECERVTGRRASTAHLAEWHLSNHKKEKCLEPELELEDCPI